MKIQYCYYDERKSHKTATVNPSLFKQHIHIKYLRIVFCQGTSLLSKPCHRLDNSTKSF